MIICRLPPEALERLGEIDRSEHVDTRFTMSEGQAVSEPASMEIPAWSPEGEGEHSLAAKTRAWRGWLANGGILLGALDGERLAGVAIVRPRLAGDLAQLALLHVSRPYRRQGVASALVKEATRIAVEQGARRMYVSATPTGSAVGFYASQGFKVANQVIPELYALEPEDIHMIMDLKSDAL